MKVAVGVAAFFVVLLVTGFGWAVNRHADQIRLLEEKTTSTGVTMAHTGSDVSDNSSALKSEQEKRIKLEVRVRDLEESLRALKAELLRLRQGSSAR